MEMVRKRIILVLCFLLFMMMATNASYAAYSGITDVKKNEITINSLGGSHQVFFELNGGVWADGYTPPDSRGYEEELVLPMAEHVKKTGCEFLGWYMDLDYSGEAQSICDVSQREDITYYARWRGNAYLLSGMEFNAALKTLANGANTGYNTFDYLIQGVQWADEVPDGAETAVVTKKTSESEILAYFDSASGVINLVNPDQVNVYMDTDSSYMFNRFGALQSVDMSKFISKDVTNLKYIFCNCAALTEFSMKDFDTSKVTNLKAIFAYCENLVTLDLSGWNVEKVTDLSSMFIECLVIESIDFEGWNPVSATTLSSAFSGCSKLKNLDIADWDTRSLTTTYYAFSDCSALTSLDLSGWNTCSLTSAQRMFDNCKKLRTLNMSGWNTPLLKNTANMFQNTYYLTEVRMDQFDMSAITNKGGMMYRAANSTRDCTIYCTEETEAALLSGTSITAGSFTFVRPEEVAILMMYKAGTVASESNIEKEDDGVASGSNAEKEESSVASGSNAEREESSIASGSNAEREENSIASESNATVER